MAEKKRCIRCNRAIDPYARICPFCNWDQSDLATPRVDQTPDQNYVPPSENLWRKYVFMAVGGVILLVAAFALGSKIQGKKPVRGLEQQGTIKTSTGPSRPAQRADVTLVPVNANDTVAVDQPITSAPATAQAQGVPPEYQRSDATAVSSVEYAQLAARADAEKKAKEKAQAVIDPRSLRGAAYAQGDTPARSQPQMSSSTEPAPGISPPEQQSSSPVPERSAEPARDVVSTKPVPEYQPIPDIQVSENSTVRLELTVGADGRVRDINVLQGIPGQTPKIISTVQTWRFRPATENGNPVSAPFTVDLSFRGQ